MMDRSERMNVRPSDKSFRQGKTMPRAPVLVTMLVGMLLAAATAARAAEPTAAPAAEPGDAQKTFDSLYGHEIKRAEASRDPADNMALATKLLRAACAADTPPDLFLLLCQKAADLGAADPKGYDTALVTADLLADRMPDKAALAQELVLPIRQKQFESARGVDQIAAAQAYLEGLLAVATEKGHTGDADEALRRCRQAVTVVRTLKPPLPEGLDADAKYLTELQKVIGRISILKTLVRPEAENRAAREELVRLWLVELDNPAQAAKYLNENSDAKVHRYVPGAAKKVEDAPELACLELADWYRDLAGSAGPCGKAAMLRHALAYYQRFLKLHKDEGMERTKAELAIKRIQGDLDKVGDLAFLGKPKPWIDLLKAVDLARDAVSGDWHWSGGALVMDPILRISKLMILVMPLGRYELELTITRTAGAEGIAVILPVGRTSADVVLGGRHNTTSGIEMINDVSAAKNETTVAAGSLEEGRLYTVRIRVSAVGDQASISVALDGKPLTRWSGPQGTLAVPTEWNLPNAKCLGLGVSNGASFAFKSARLRMLSGKASAVARPEPPPAPPAARPADVPNPPRGPGSPRFGPPVWGR